MATFLDNLIVATLALRPDAAGCLDGSTCFVQATGIRYQVRGGSWRQMSDDAQAGGGGSSGSGVDPTLTEEADLDAIETVDITPGDVGSIVQYIDSNDEQLKTWQLRTSTATSVARSVRRAGDYSVSNTKVWFLVA